MKSDSQIELSKKNKIILTIFLVVILIISPFIVLFFINLNLGSENVTNITTETAYNMILNNDSSSNIIILDVRSQEEYDIEHLNNSIIIPQDELEGRISEIEQYKNVEIIVYCYSGTRSTFASGILENNGFLKINNMLGGINKWKSDGYPVVS